MSHRLNNAIGGHLHRLQALAQMAKGLVMVACHRRSAAQKAGQLSHSQGPVDQVAPGLLVARDMAVQVAAEVHIQRLHPPTNAQDRASALHKGLYQLSLGFVKSFPDVAAAGEQQTAAQSGVSSAETANRNAPGGINGLPVAAQSLLPAGDENGRDHGLHLFFHLMPPIGKKSLQISCTRVKTVVV